jgi:RND superfamily putative drug exporter
MLTRLGQLVVRRRKVVLALTALLVVAAAAFGGDVADHLTTGGFRDPHAQSTKAAAVVRQEFGQSEPNIILLVTAREGTVDDPAVRNAGAALTAELAASPHVSSAVSYWSLGAPPLRSTDARQAIVLGRIDGTDDQVRDRITELSPRFTRTTTVVKVGVGGQAEVFRQVGTQIESDLATAEMIVLPITLLLLVFIFGSVVAASLPLAVGVIAVIGTFLVLRVLAATTDVSIFALNLTTALGLGLAIDYSLFVVSRYREEMAGGLEPHAAVVRAVETAGKTVAFSALTVAVSLAALLVFPLAFLRSFAYAGIAVAIIAALGAVIALPALLAVLGRNVDRWVLFRHGAKPTDEGIWHRVATFVMRRPVPVATIVVLVLIVLGLPFFRIVFGLPDDRVLPASATSAQVHADIRERFGSGEASALQVVSTRLAPDDLPGQIASYATRLSALPGVARVDAVTGSYAAGRQLVGPNDASTRFLARDGDRRATWWSVVPAVEANSPAGEHLVHEVRALEAPWPVQVAGPSAELVDGKASLFARMPLALGLIALSTFVLLFMMFGGLLVPVKALVINVLSLSATFGAMVWIFQDGHLSGFLGFTPTGTLDTTTPILMFCVAFGLSMDYEVFLLSRIKEEYDLTGDNEHSVAVGLERTGRIVTAAALLIAIVFLAFSTSQITFIKLFGIGLALAVLMDAFVIRATLVPAFMRLAGTGNWWAPAPLRRFHDRFGIRETAPVPAPPTDERELEPAPLP